MTYWIGFSVLPFIATGGYLSSALALISAPICFNGVMTLAIGLPLKDSSPVRTEKNGLPDKTPESILIVVPGISAVNNVMRFFKAINTVAPYNQVVTLIIDINA